MGQPRSNMPAPLVRIAPRKARRQRLPRPPQDAYADPKLSLFQSFVCNTEEERGKRSNTIDLWDAVPKYCCSRKQMASLRVNGSYLPSMQREFRHRDRRYLLRLYPAPIRDLDDVERYYYPSAREELVEDALRKLSTEEGMGFHGEAGGLPRSGVSFSLYRLRKELAARGHSITYADAKQSLLILARTEIEISEMATGRTLETWIISLTGVTSEELKDDPNARWYVDFNVLVSESIIQCTYRQFDYARMMSHRTQFARWLHKRLAHNYTNASLIQPYVCLFSSLRRDSGLLEYARARDAVAALDESLGILQDDRIISSVDRVTQLGRRNRIEDVKYSLIPHPEFVREVKAANHRLANRVV